MQIRKIGQKCISILPKPDPEKGVTVFEPDGKGYGYWVGGHDVTYDPKEKKFYLYFRVRKPLGKGRGVECRIAESDDGINYTTIWTGNKKELNAKSLEVGSLIKDPYSGRWRLYISVEDADTKQWRVDLVEGDHPAEFDLWSHRTVMAPQDFGINVIKDPRVYIIGGLYHAFVCVNSKECCEVEKTGNTEIRRPIGMDATALMTSSDGVYWRDLEYVFEPGKGAQGEWGHYRARINSIIWIPPTYLGFFDGGETFYDNFEEQCGVAVSHDLKRWTRVTRNDPWIKGPYGPIRYMYAIIIEENIYYYYEYTMENGGHEIRVSKMNLRNSTQVHQP